MKKLSPAEALDVALRTAAREAEPGVPRRRLAEKFYESEGVLVGHFLQDWAIEKLDALLGKYLLQLRRANDPQLLLFDFRLPDRIILKSGEKVDRGMATMRKLKQARSRALEQKTRVIQKWDSAIAFMEPYSREQHGITYNEAMELELRKRGISGGRQG